MKTAVSIPDPLFDAAEKMAGRLGISRSRLYAHAIERFVKSYRKKGITEAPPSTPDSGSSRLHRLTALSGWVRQVAPRPFMQ